MECIYDCKCTATIVCLLVGVGLDNVPFSGFSVGFCINEEKVICCQLELRKYFANIRALMMTGALSRNVGKLFSELKLVTNNLLFI